MVHSGSLATDIFFITKINHGIENHDPQSKPKDLFAMQVDH